MKPDRLRSHRRIGFVLLLAITAGGLTPLIGADTPKPGDDATYRPTVMVRRGKGLGSGTIIASVEGETLVLTASHVVNEAGPVIVELFRFNVGAERVQLASGFPRMLEASIVARDPDADLAILRIRGQLALPYVAKIAKGDVPPASRSKVTTIGYDKGDKIIGFSTRLRTVEQVDLNQGGGHRPFLVTDDPPEHGRSGGGLFRSDGALVGVCIGRIDLPEGKTFGLFSALENVRELIKSDKEIAAVVARSPHRVRAPAR